MVGQSSKLRKLLAGTLIILTLFILYRRRGAEPISLGSGPLETLNQTLGFQKIFVVNLPERTDRRDAMSLAGAVTGLEFTYANGVRGTDVAEKVLPPGERSASQKWTGKIGSWRAHMNVLQTIIHENLTSALIMEDDTDWDIRLKSQVQTFAIASRAYLQPLGHKSTQTLASLHPPSSPNDNQHYVNLLRVPQTRKPTSSPFGDGWDIIWLGHMGSELPSEWRQLTVNPKHKPRSLLTLFLPGDQTVPIPGHLKRHPFADRLDSFAERFQPHTRVFHESRETTGIQAYAVSQRGARKLLWQFGLETFTSSYDLLVRDWCDGVYLSQETAADRPVCVTTQPPLISQYYAKGGSDIHGIGGGYFHKTGSTYIRYSVRRNMERLLASKTGDNGDVDGLVDQWQDGGKGAW